MTTWLRDVAFALALASSLACSKDRKPCPPDNGPDYTLLPAVQVRQMTGDLRYTATPTWTPTTTEVREMETIIERLLREECSRISRSQTVMKLAFYYRQYAAVLRDNRRVLFINAFNKAELRHAHGNVCDWRSQVVRIADGGVAFFLAAYVVESRKFGYFSFNGGVRGVPPLEDRWDEILQDQPPSTGANPK